MDKTLEEYFSQLTELKFSLCNITVELLRMNNIVNSMSDSPLKDKFSAAVQDMNDVCYTLIHGGVM